MKIYSRLLLYLCSLILMAFLLGGVGCSIFAARPVQEMSFTAASIRAAKEVQADTLAPEFYRQANEWFFRAKHEYKFKNFKLAKEYADKARYFAEQAEFEALRNGGNRGDPGAPPPDEAAAAAAAEKPAPYAYPTPTGTPADVYDQRKAVEDREKNGASQSPGGGAGSLPGAGSIGGAK